MRRSSAPGISVIILTLNEELNLPGLLESLQGLDAEMFVVDSGSTDGTRAIAERAGCEFVEHPFVNHSRQLNWALSNLPLRAPWALRLDADERLSTELARELSAVPPTLPASVTGLLVRRRFLFWGRWLKHGGMYPVWLLRAWRRGAARCEQKWMDEHMVLLHGESHRLSGDIIHEFQGTLGSWTRKHTDYAERAVRDLLADSVKSASDVCPDPERVKRRRRHALYARLPLFARAFFYWFYRYFLRLGFLDGRPGLVFHFLHAFWYRFLIDAKLVERRRKPR